MVGELCDKARVADVELELTMVDGTVLTGVPRATADHETAADQVDHTGYADRVEIAGDHVELTAISQVSLRLPPA